MHALSSKQGIHLGELMVVLLKCHWGHLPFIHVHDLNMLRRKTLKLCLFHYDLYGIHLWDVVD
jgi:hypothetical protein